MAFGPEGYGSWSTPPRILRSHSVKRAAVRHMWHVIGQTSLPTVCLNWESRNWDRISLGLDGPCRRPRKGSHTGDPTPGFRQRAWVEGEVAKPNSGPFLCTAHRMKVAFQDSPLRRAAVDDPRLGIDCRTRRMEVKGGYQNLGDQLCSATTSGFPRTRMIQAQ